MNGKIAVIIGMCVACIVALGAFISICRKGIKEFSDPLHHVVTRNAPERIECDVLDIIPETSRVT